MLGFEFSRPETYFSAGLEDKCLARDIYRHPDRQQSPTQPFSKLHDIYALGVVLLEIGAYPCSGTDGRELISRRSLAAGLSSREVRVYSRTAERDQQASRPACRKAAGIEDGRKVPGHCSELLEKRF